MSRGLSVKLQVKKQILHKPIFVGIKLHVLSSNSFEVSLLFFPPLLHQHRLKAETQPVMLYLDLDWLHQSATCNSYFYMYYRSVILKL